MIVLLEYLALIVQDLLSKLVVLPIYKSSAVEWLALLRRIREVRGSNPGPETDYPYSEVCRAFLSLLLQILEQFLS
jgi:hypothetical protein